jgi:hypothetical protein
VDYTISRRADFLARVYKNIETSALSPSAQIDPEPGSHIVDFAI